LTPSPPASLPRGEGSSAIGEFKVCSLPILEKSVFVIPLCGVPPLPSGEGVRGRGATSGEGSARQEVRREYKEGQENIIKNNKNIETFCILH